MQVYIKNTCEETSATLYPRNTFAIKFAEISSPRGISVNESKAIIIAPCLTEYAD